MLFPHSKVKASGSIGQRITLMVKYIGSINIIRLREQYNNLMNYI